ncbi:hypothetical protein [Devosia ginsengisoli]|uniref:hypothetical protein n=1 Tax=Devosia ginsengisoli TaxID=400770 RepID=UPI0026F1F1B3|nr:hypothetical protein [Devosia ginsengisoli]MCR6672217.1 hypothetical protein [Devosia ginsengisoli]
MIGQLRMGTVLAALAVAGVAGTAGWLARGLVVDRIEIPRVIEQQAEICEQVAERHAAEAVTAEQLRQFKIGEAAWDRFNQQSQAAADDAQAKQDVLELELERYAQRARDAGRVCALDDADLELIGVRQAAEPAGPGGR